MKKPDSHNLLIRLPSCPLVRLRSDRVRLIGVRTRFILPWIALLGCRSGDHAPANDPPRAAPVAAPAPAAGSGSAGDPTFAVLRQPDGTTTQASPEQTVATLGVNCDTATRGSTLAVACFSLGQLYDTGTFVAKDGKRAMELHERACTLGEMRGCAELGAFYDDGVVIPRDAARANAYFRQACDGGNGRGCNSLILLHPETATTADIVYVLARYRAICDAGGDPEACMGLGDAYRIGKYVRMDPQRAIELYTKACNADHATACNNLGAMHALGIGGPIDKTAALLFYKKACDLGSRDACINAGIDPTTAAIQLEK